LILLPLALAVTQRYAEEAQRNTKGLFWNAEACGEVARKRQIASGS